MFADRIKSLVNIKPYELRVVLTGYCLQVDYRGRGCKRPGYWAPDFGLRQALHSKALDVR